MAHNPSQVTRIIEQGTLLGSEGEPLDQGRWKARVYLGPDNHIYHLIAEASKGTWKTRIAGKRTVGEYLRWVDGLFRPGELPDASNAIHYRAARKLRELL